MSWLGKLVNAFTKGVTIEVGTGPGTPQVGSLAEDEPPANTMGLFAYRMTRLTPDQWQRVVEVWDTTTADPVAAAARAAADRAAADAEERMGRHMDFQSNVAVEPSGLAGLIIGANAQLAADVDRLREAFVHRQEPIRCALTALVVRDVLSPDAFTILYAPFEPFVPRAELEGVGDWGTPAHPAGAESLAVPQPEATNR
jgi:hypothetical protein